MNEEKCPRPAVLVVDDEALIRWSLGQALGDAGYSVQFASTAAETRLALLDSGDPLVVLLDLKLPDASDLSLARHIRAARPDAAVIMMTAHGTNDDVSQALIAGVLCVVSKPFDVAEVVALVGNALDTANPIA